MDATATVVRRRRVRRRVVRGQGAGAGVVQAGDGDALRLVDLLLLVGEEGRI